MLKGKRKEKGGKKRSKPTSSSEESPPKGYVPEGRSKESGQSDETAAKPDSTLATDENAKSPSSVKVSPSKLEDIASQHRESRTGVVQNLTDDQMSEVGVRIFRKWTSLRQKLRVKLDSGLKKSKVISDEPNEEEKSVPVEKSGLPNMVNLINEEIECLEKVRSEVEAEYEEEMRQDPVEKADEAWERYRFKKDAFSRHKVARCLAITLRESAEMTDRLTALMSTMQLMIRGSPIAEAAATAADPHPELDTFFHDLQQTRDRLNSQSSSDDSLQQSKSCSSGDSMVAHASRSPRKSPSPSESATL